MSERKLELGDRVRDTVTGYVGTVTGRAEYLTGPPRVGVAGIDSTGRPVDVWEDEARFEAAGEGTE